MGAGSVRKQCLVAWDGKFTRGMVLPKLLEARPSKIANAKGIPVGGKGVSCRLDSFPLARTCNCFLCFHSTVSKGKRLVL